MNSDDLTVYLIEDDPAVLNSLSSLLYAAGHRVRSFESAEHFLVSLPENPAGCVITDIRLTGMSGIELQQRMKHSGVPLPVVVVSGFASVPVAVEMMQNGAVTLLQKPFQPEQLLGAVDQALQQFRNGRQQQELVESINRRLNLLNEEERGVMALMVQGRANKEISATLTISPRTVDRRRSQVLEKMQVQSVPELARLLTLVEVAQGSSNSAS